MIFYIDSKNIFDCMPYCLKNQNNNIDFKNIFDYILYCLKNQNNKTFLH